MKSFVARIRPRTWIIAAVVIAALAGGSVYWFGFGLPAQAQEGQPTTRTVQAATQTMQKTVSSTGTLAPTVDEDVNFVATGRVTAVNVAAGATVKAGDVLATVDTLTVDADLLSAKATLASAQAKLSDAQDASTGSTSDVAQIASAQSAVAVAQASVVTAQAAVDGATLTAPVAGLVTAVNLEVGDSVTGTSSSSSGSSGSSGSGASGGSTGSGSSSGSGSATGSSGTTSSTAQFTIVGTGSWQVSVSVSASDVKSIAKGNQVELSTTDGGAFYGTVASIGLLPSTTTGAATYPVVVDVTGSPENLYDGVTVTAEIVYERRTDVLTVPSAAITTADGKSTVTKVVDGKNVTTTVTTGETSGSVTEITKGLSSGDSVVVKTFTPAGTGNSGGTGTQGGTGSQGGEGGFPGGGELPGGGTFPGGGTGGAGTQNGGNRG